MKTKIVLLLCLIVLASGQIFSQANKKITGRKNITIGMIGKIGSNPVFIAAHTGAQVAAKELGAKYNAEVFIDWQTPDVENVKEQEIAIERLIHSKVNGIAIACSDANILTPAINSAVEKGIPVMCFDSDAPMSMRFAYYGADDMEFGRLIMEQLAQELNGKGTIAVLAGSKNALNQQLRLKGVKEELKKHSNIVLPSDNIYNNIEIPGPSAELIAHEQKAKPHIIGWVFQGSWPLLKKNAIPWKPGTIKIAAGNAVPAELDYVKSGYVQSLVGVNCFEYGYKTIEIMLDKIINNVNPEKTRMYIPLTIVTKTNVDEWSLNWKKWLIKEAIYR
jgi:ribose transport system substrate-binding protein